MINPVVSTHSLNDFFHLQLLGNFQYEKIFNNPIIQDETKPLTLDSTFWIASCTKLMTSIAALQCVERGLLNLDGDAADILPELKGISIISGFDDAGKPILKKAEKIITLRYMQYPLYLLV